MLEMSFKTKFLIRLEERLPQVDLDFVHTKPRQRSYPDTFVIGPHVWAALEFKRAENAPHQPNQVYYVNHFRQKGYANFVYPENAEEVLDELEDLFTS